MVNEELQEFFKFLKESHTGKANAITSKSMSQWGKSPDIRAKIHALRVAGFPICSTNQGYYVAENSEDLKETLTFLRGYLTNIQRAYDGLLDTHYEMRFDEIQRKGG